MDEPPLFSKNIDELLPPDPGPAKGASPRPPRPSGQASAPGGGARWGPSRWWQFGLLGAFVLSWASAIKFVRALRGGGAPVDHWAELPGMAAALFGIGFLCGVIVWAGRGLHRRVGRAGDALVGVAVMVTFFAAVMLVTEPELLGEKFATGGAPMLGLAAVLGPVAGLVIGKDLRKESGPR